MNSSFEDAHCFPKDVRTTFSPVEGDIFFQGHCYAFLFLKLLQFLLTHDAKNTQCPQWWGWTTLNLFAWMLIVSVHHRDPRMEIPSPCLSPSQVGNGTITRPEKQKNKDGSSRQVRGDATHLVEHLLACTEPCHPALRRQGSEVILGC